SSMSIPCRWRGAREESVMSSASARLSSFSQVPRFVSFSHKRSDRCQIRIDMTRARYPARREAERNYQHKVDIPVPRTGLDKQLRESHAGCSDTVEPGGRAQKLHPGDDMLMRRLDRRCGAARRAPAPQ